MPAEALSLDGSEKEWSFGRLLNLEQPDLSWQLVDSGLSLYACGFKVNDAEGLGINFNHLPQNQGTLWVTSASEILGGFDAACRPKHGAFAVRPLKGNSLVLWWQGASPPSVEAQAVVVPSWKKLEGFGDAGDCLPDAACPEALGWEDPRRSVVLLLTNNNTRFCTGTLVNNTQENGRPLLLTGRHCNAQANSIVWFGYESPFCEGGDGPNQKSLQGLIPLAERAQSDMELFELAQQPLPQWQVYFAGWSRDSLAPAETHCLQHPRGDVMKYARDNQAPGRSVYVGPDLGTGPYWRVNDWDVGTTEPGSSGAALFNPNKQVIGTLHGGFASCSNDLEDYFGGLYASWDGPADTLRLRDWLDPFSTQTMALNGRYIPVPALQRDLGLKFPFPDSILRCNSGPVQVLCTNYGMQMAQNLQLFVRVHGQEQSVLLNRPLDSGDSLYVNLRPWLPSDPEFLDVEVELVGIFSAGQEEYPVDNTSTLHLVQREGTQVGIEYRTDEQPGESLFLLKDRNATLVYALADTAANSMLEQNICVLPECYLWIAMDAGGDGICCGEGQGSFSWSWGSQAEIWEGFQDFGSLDTVGFCVPQSYAGPNLMGIYPNPAFRSFRFFFPAELLDEPVELRFYDVSGRLAYTWVPKKLIWEEVIPEALAPGVYMLVLVDLQGNIISKARLVWSSDL